MCTETLNTCVSRPEPVIRRVECMEEPRATAVGVTVRCEEATPEEGAVLAQLALAERIILLQRRIGSLRAMAECRRNAGVDDGSVS